MISTTEREYAITQLDQTRERLLGILQGLSRDQLLFRPDPGRWSVAENVEHLVVAEKRVVGAIDKLLEEPPDFSTQRGISDEEVVKKVGTALERVQSPSHSLPKLRWPAEQLLKRPASALANSRVQPREISAIISYGILSWASSTVISGYC